MSRCDASLRWRAVRLAHDQHRVGAVPVGGCRDGVRTALHLPARRNALPLEFVETSFATRVQLSGSRAAPARDGRAGAPRERWGGFHDLRPYPSVRSISALHRLAERAGGEGLRLVMGPVGPPLPRDDETTFCEHLSGVVEGGS